MNGYGIYWRPVSNDYPRTGSLSVPSLYFYVNNGAVAASASSITSVPFPVETGSDHFHHIVGTYDEHNLSLFVDGLLVATRSYSSPIAPGTAPLTIGKGFSSALEWSGGLDEAAIYDYALTPSQVLAHYQAGIAECSDVRPCSAGWGTCTSDAQCQPGLVCGSSNGAAFQLAATDSVCWPASCASDPTTPACSSVPKNCAQNSDCATGTTCSSSVCCTPGLDTDGDSLDDCTEYADGDPWTNPLVFNGMHARLADHCNGRPAASLDATNVDICVSTTPHDEKDQSSGWNWPDGPDNVCNASYEFSPAWTNCQDNWQIDWKGFIKLENTGTYCFAPLGTGNLAVASLFFDNDTDPVTFATGADCYQVSAGVYPIHWYFEMADGSTSDFHVAYCYTRDGASCEPEDAIPSRLLRTKYKGTEQLCETGSSKCSDLCPCTGGHGSCSTDSQCASGSVCGPSNGVAFGLSATQSVCWPSYCAATPGAVGCTSIPVGCATDSDCPGGDVCGSANGDRFGLPSSVNVCWPAMCLTDSGASCGSLHAPCGLCACTPNCADRVCGDQSDGCGGKCPALCTPGQAGCDSDLDCSQSSRCATNAGAMFGMTTNRNICISGACLTSDAATFDCGQASSTCGIACPTCSPQCGSQTCGPDPVCGAPCGAGPCQFGDLPSGSLSGCSANGQCLAVVNGPVDALSDNFPATQFNSAFPIPSNITLRQFTGPFNSPEAPTAGVGALPGKLATTKDGLSTYEIPIEVLPNRNNLTPRLAFAYSSAKPDSFLGIGWHLRGLSEISRCARTRAQDAWNHGISLSADDRYCLDGQRLVVQPNNTNGADGAQYRTEFDTFRRVTSLGGTATTGPNTWLVEGPDGLQYRYGEETGLVRYRAGGTSNPTINRKWLLTSIQDRSGNRIDIQYVSPISPLCDTETASDNFFCGDTEVLPTTITYGQNPSAGATASTRSIDFHYRTAPRSDPRVGYDGGSTITKTALLDRLEIRGIAPNLGREGTFAAYNLSYSNAPNGSTILSTISHCAVDASGQDTCEPATAFSYEQPSAPLQYRAPTQIAVGAGFGNGISSPTTGIVDTLLLDVNGDGRADLLNNSTSPTDNLNPDDTSPYPARQIFQLALASGVKTQPFQTPTNITFPLGLCATSQSVFDFNFDGRDDVLDGCPRNIDGTDSEGNKLIGYRIFVSNGSGFDVHQVPYGGDGGDREFSSDFRTRAIVMDLDGDTLPDLVEFTFSDIRYRPNTGSSGFGAPITLSSLAQFGDEFAFDPDPWDMPEPLIIDVDGDGVGNIVAYDSVNKDWRALILSSATKATWVPTGLGLSDVIANPELIVKEGLRSYVKLMDVNGDGLTDVLENRVVNYASANVDPPPLNLEVLTQPNPHISTMLWVNTGRTFAPTSIVINGNISSDEFAQALVDDIDSDGRDELLAPMDPGDGRGTRFFAIHFDLSTNSSSLQEITPAIVPAIVNASVAGTVLPVSADVDGDGTRDLLIADDPTSASAGAPFGNLSTYFGSDLSQNELTSITDGLGYQNSIVYGSSDDTYVPGTTCTAQSQCVPRLNGRVETIAQSFFGTLRGSTKYRYSDARVGTGGRGWLGFAQVETTILDPDSNFTRDTTDTFDNQTYDSTTQSYPFAGLVNGSRAVGPIVAEGLSSSNPSESVSVTSTDWELLTASSGRPFVQVGTRQAQIYEIPPSTPLWETTEEFAYDEFGNELGSATTVIDDVAGVTTRNEQVTRAFDYLDETDWFIRSPSSVTVDAFRGGQEQANTVAFQYDDKRRISQFTREPSSTDPTATLVVHVDSYDGYGNPTAIRAEGTATHSATSRTESINYEGLNIFPEVIVDSLGHQTQYRYDERFGLPQTIIEPNGLVTGYTYDGFGRLGGYTSPTKSLTVSYQGGPAAAPSYGTLQAVKNVLGGPTTITTYDPVGEIVAVDQTGFKDQVFGQEFTYDWDGRKRTASRPHVPGDSSQGVILYSYDSARRLAQESYPDGNVVISAYSNRPIEQSNEATLFAQPGGNDLVLIQDSDGVQRVTASDYLGNVIASVDGRAPDASTMQFSYGPQNALSTVTDQSGNVTTMSRDIFGRLRTRTDPDSGISGYIYDSFGEIETTQDALGRTADYSFDAMGRLFNHATHGSRDDTYSYTYDTPGNNAIGRLVSATSSLGDGQVVFEQFQYDDPAGLPSDVVENVNGSSFAEHLSWDELGRLGQVQFPVSGQLPFSLTYTYDTADGELESVAQSGAPGPSTLWQLTASDSGFRPKTWTYGNGSTTTFSYFPTNGLVSGISSALSGGAPVRNLSYAYTAADKMWTRTDSVLGRTETFHYDSLGRLVSRSQQLPTDTTSESFSYDPLGNIGSWTPLGTYTYDGSTGGGPHAVNKIGDTEYHYDAVGNMTERSGSHVALSEQELEYTGRDELERINAGTGSSGLALSYIYDALGTKVFRQEVNGGQTTPANQTFFMGASYSDTRSGGQDIHRYRIPGPAGPVGEFTRTVNADGTVAAQKLTYIHSDLLGSSVDVTDDEGVVSRRSFTPFGELEGGSDPLSITDPGFTGHRHESDLGLIDMRGRFFDPGIGRFLSPDPNIQLPLNSQSWNAYSYVLNSPMNGTDPTGFWPGFGGGDSSGGYIGAIGQSPSVLGSAPGIIGAVSQLGGLGDGVDLNKPGFDTGADGGGGSLDGTSGASGAGSDGYVDLTGDPGATQSGGVVGVREVSSDSGSGSTAPISGGGGLPIGTMGGSAFAAPPVAAPPAPRQAPRPSPDRWSDYRMPGDDRPCSDGGCIDFFPVLPAFGDLFQAAQSAWGWVVAKLWGGPSAEVPPQGGESPPPAIGPKIAKQMGPRGWTMEQIVEAIKNGDQVQAVNKATGAPAIRYIHPVTGQSVVVDEVINEVIQVGGPGFKFGPGSGDLP